MSSKNQESVPGEVYNETAESKPAAISRAKALGNIACHAVLENGEKIDMGDKLLDGMRTWLHESATNLLREGRVGEWRELYPALFDEMESLHRAGAAVYSDTPLSDKAPGLLLANYLRYLDSSQGSKELTREQLSALYEAYASDVQLCRDIKIPAPERIAYHQGKQCLSRLIEQYGDCDFLRGDDFVKAISNYVKSPETYFKRLVSGVVEFQTVIEPRLRKEYDATGEPWSSTFIAGLVRRFSDVEAAARSIFELIPTLRSNYAHATDTAIERWAKQIVTEPQPERRVEIDKLLTEVPALTIEDGERQRAIKALNCIREALVSGRIRVNATNLDSAGVHRLVRVAEANWHESFEDGDMLDAARNIYFMIKAYNEHAKETKTLSPIATTSANLHAILVAFTSDICALKKEVAPSKAAKIARYYGPGICERLHEQFRDKEIPLSVIGDLFIKKSVKGITAAIEAYAKRNDILKEMLKDEKLVGLHGFACLEDGPVRAQKYLTFLVTAREKYHWVGRMDVAEFFYSSDRPVAHFNAWAEKVEAIRKQTNVNANRTATNFSVFVIKRIAKDKKRSADALIRTHTEKCKAAFAPYQHNPYVTRPMISLWATREVPEDAIKNHLKRVDEVKDLLVKAGEDETDTVLVRDLAFYGSHPQKAVAKYIAIKKVLEEDREMVEEEYQDVEQWMIVQTASRSNQLIYARHKLRILSRTIRKQELNRPGESLTGEKSQQVEKKMAEKNYTSFADLNQVAALVEDLHELDKMALLAVFGFDEEYGGGAIDTEWLQGELGVRDLEAYVMEEVIPHIRTVDRS